MRSAFVVGREAELHRLRGVLDAASSGNGSMVVLRGEAGAGKTRVAAELAADARAHGSVVLRGRATEVGGSAYRALREALLGAARLGVDIDAVELAPFRSALGQLVPPWRGDSFVVSDETDVVIGEAIVQLLIRLGSRAPTVLVLEDLHWADLDTLAIVEYLADNLGSAHALCVVTCRTLVRSRGGEVVADLVNRRSARAVDLGRLDDDAMRQLVRAILGESSETVADLAIRRADGLPFLLEELLGAAVDAGELIEGPQGWMWRGNPTVVPTSVADSVRRKLDWLPPDARRIVAAAALCGMRPDSTALTRGLDQPETAVIGALRHAVDAELMTVDGEAFQFRHALTREAVATGLAGHQRGDLARALAPVVEPGDPELASSLHTLAGDHDAAAGALATAARRALEAGALSTAVELADRASHIGPVALATMCDLDEVLTEALALAGNWERVFEAGNRLLSTLVELDAPVTNRVGVYLRLARAALAAGMQGLAATHAERARALLGQASPELSRRLDVLDAAVAIEASRLDDARSLAEGALAAAEREGPAEVACEALEILGRIERLQDVRAAEGIFRRGAEIAERSGLVVWQIRAVHELGIAEMFRGELATLESTRSLAISAGLLSVAVDVDHQIAGIHIFRLEPGALIDAGERALLGALRLRLDAPAAVAHVHVATGHAMGGRRGEALRRIEQARSLAPDLPDIEIYAGQALALGSLLQEQRRQALEDVEGAMAVALANPATPPGAHKALWPLLRALDHDDGTAADVIRAQVGASMVTRGFVDYADAILAGRRGDGAGAIRARAAGDACVGEHWAGFRHLGRRLVAEGALRDGWGEPVPWLRELIVRFSDLGFPHVVAACRTLLREAGAPVPRPRTSAPAVPAELARLGVTGRELEVMQLVRQGLSNAEIASRLVLSVRTVEKHVESLLSKTGAPTRRELAGIAT